MFGDQSKVAGLTASAKGSPVTPRVFIAAVTGPPSPAQSCPTSTGRMPAHIALLTDRKLLATFAFALAHGCAIRPRRPSKLYPSNCSSRGNTTPLI